MRDLRSFAADTALMVILCVVAMFLHPIAHGPYSAVHGPTTALRAGYRARALFAIIALTGAALAARLGAVGRLFTGTVFAAMTMALPGSSPGAVPLRC